MRTLTYRQLVEAKACRNQLALFRERYGDQVSVTVEAAREAAQLFDWEWAAKSLLSVPAQEAYLAAVASARAAYEAATNSAWAAYEAAYDSARAAYRAATAPAWVAREAAKAEAFALAYISDEGNGK